MELQFFTCAFILKRKPFTVSFENFDKGMTTTPRRGEHFTPPKFSFFGKQNVWVLPLFIYLFLHNWDSIILISISFFTYHYIVTILYVLTSKV